MERQTHSCGNNKILLWTNRCTDGHTDRETHELRDGQEYIHQDSHNF
jgi:hypothetical protein